MRGQRRLTGMLAFATPPGFTFDHTDVDQQRELVAAAFRRHRLGGAATGRRDAGGRRLLLRHGEPDPDAPVDERRVALVGDAAHAPALLSGQGTSLAMVGAYVLAGELAAADGDPAAAFAGYERVMRPFAERNQDLARHGGAALIASTRTQLWLRNRMLTVLPHLGSARRLLNGRFNKASRSFRLPDYAHTTAASRK